jgi:tetratricopeptide (TPR) repeat protein
MGDVQLSTMLSTLRLRRREAYLVLSDANRRAAYDKRLGTAAPTSHGHEITAERHSRAKTLAHEARALLERGDREPAIPLLLEAVDLDPEERPARRLLALTLASHPNLQRSAERHFLIALEQDSADLDLRYRLGRYYRSLGLPARALVHLQAVLDADPDHAGARRELEALSGDRHTR